MISDRRTIWRLRIGQLERHAGLARAPSRPRGSTPGQRPCQVLARLTIWRALDADRRLDFVAGDHRPGHGGQHLHLTPKSASLRSIRREVYSRVSGLTVSVAGGAGIEQEQRGRQRGHRDGLGEQHGLLSSAPGAPAARRAAPPLHRHWRPAAAPVRGMIDGSVRAFLDPYCARCSTCPCDCRSGGRSPAGRPRRPARARRGPPAANAGALEAVTASMPDKCSSRVRQQGQQEQRGTGVDQLVQARLAELDAEQAARLQRPPP